MSQVLKIFGIIFFLLGITVLFNSFQGITGFAVYEDVNLDGGFLVGAWFILTGALLIVYRREVKDDKRKRKN